VEETEKAADLVRMDWRSMKVVRKSHRNAGVPVAVAFEGFPGSSVEAERVAAWVKGWASRGS
jgi:hypothetical protein